MARNIVRECLGYTTYNLCIFMPKGKESCQYCPCLKYEHDSDCRRCKMTGEIIIYYKTEKGARCPLFLKEDE